MIRRVKAEIRILGVDDAPFKKSDDRVLLVGTVFRAGTWLDGVLSTHIDVDGTDATDKIIELFEKTGHKDQIRVIMLNGITVGGFNTVDLEKLSHKTKKPVIVVVRDEPDFKSIREALKNFEDGDEKWKLIEKAGEVKSIKIKGGKLYFQHEGLDEFKTREIIELTCTHSRYPEPLRVAHMIGAGIVLGRTRGGK